MPSDPKSGERNARRRRLDGQALRGLRFDGVRGDLVRRLRAVDRDKEDRLEQLHVFFSSQCFRPANDFRFFAGYTQSLRAVA